MACTGDERGINAEHPNTGNAKNAHTATRVASPRTNPHTQRHGSTVSRHGSTRVCAWKRCGVGAALWAGREDGARGWRACCLSVEADGLGAHKLRQAGAGPAVSQRRHLLAGGQPRAQRAVLVAQRRVALSQPGHLRHTTAHRRAAHTCAWQAATSPAQARLAGERFPLAEVRVRVHVWPLLLTCLRRRSTSSLLSCSSLVSRCALLKLPRLICCCTCMLLSARSYCDCVHTKHTVHTRTHGSARRVCTRPVSRGRTPHQLMAQCECPLTHVSRVAAC